MKEDAPPLSQYYKTPRCRSRWPLYLMKKLPGCIASCALLMDSAMQSTMASITDEDTPRLNGLVCPPDRLRDDVHYGFHT